GASTEPNAAISTTPAITMPERAMTGDRTRPRKRTASRARPGRPAGESVSSLNSVPAKSHARVGEGVGDVGQKIGDDDERGHEHGDRLNRRDVLRRRGLHQKVANALDGERHLR